MKKAFTFKLSSRKLRSAGLRDISRLFIPRTTTLRGDGVGVRAFTQNINHSRGFLSGISALLTKQRDRRLQTSGMVSGFTLIELLVVVLIIGILSAIALPQYQKAVLRARYVQLVTLGDSICRASNLYYMANNTWTTDFDQLDISLPPGGEVKVEGHGTTVTYAGKFWIKLLNASDANLTEGKLLGTGLEYVHYCQRKQKECRSYNRTVVEQGVCASEGASKVNCSGCSYDVYLY